MLQPGELRLGNWVETYMVMLSGSWYDKSGKQHGQDVITEPAIRHKQIDIKDLEIISSLDGFLATYRPIPLTPEILEKCGFYKLNDDHYTDNLWFKSPIHLYINNGKIQHDGYDREVKSLHQLQNLYFALTGEELNYKP